MATAEETRVKLPPSLRRYLSDLGRRGGEARAKKLNKKTRIEQAKRAASFRWPAKNKAATPSRAASTK